jgi:WD40 repeat protein
MYLHDVTNTKGHTHQVEAGQWHPRHPSVVLTCGQDCSVRLWDLNGPMSFHWLQAKTTLRVKDEKGFKTAANTIRFTKDGSVILCGAGDGSIQMWATRNTKQRLMSVWSGDGAHAGGQDPGITSIDCAQDGNSIASRSSDGSVRLWDIRKFTKPTKILKDIETFCPYSQVKFSPDSTLLAVGTNNRKKDDGTGKSAQLLFFDTLSAAEDTDPVHYIGFQHEASIVSLCWHKEINQILCGFSSGRMKCLYDPKLSKKGALLASKQKLREKDPTDWTPELNNNAVGKIFNPHALPMYRDEEKDEWKKKRMERKDPIKTKKPDYPVNGPAKAKMNSRSSLATYMISGGGGKRKTIREEDPREQLLKYAKKAAEDPIWVGQAYKNTAPVTLLHDKTQEHEKEQSKKEYEDELMK